MLQNLTEWKNEYRKHIWLFAVIFFVAFLSFGLGYLANREVSHAPIVIEQCDALQGQ